MTRGRTLTRDEVRRALATAPPDDAVARACAEVLLADPREVFDAPTAYARDFGSTMRRKFFNARRAGRVVHGGDAFVATLEALGDDELLGVYSPGDPVVTVLVEPGTLRYVTGYLMT